MTAVTEEHLLVNGLGFPKSRAGVTAPSSDCLRPLHGRDPVPVVSVSTTATSSTITSGSRTW